MRGGALTGAAALAAALWTGGAAAGQWDESYFPNVPLVTQDGEEVRFYDDLVDDRIVVVNFAYTDCPDICGLSTARMGQIVDWLGDKVGRDVFVYTISLDPEVDTPEKLKAYAEAFGAGPGWTFLTGTRENIDTVRFKLGERSESLAEHRSDMVIGNDRTGQWRRTSLMGSLVVATTDILELDPDWRPPTRTAVVRAPAEASALNSEDKRGEALFLTGCAACHTIGNGVRVGPDLGGVTLRRDRGWLVDFLRAPDLMLESGDPVAVALDAAFPVARMPNLDLGPTDVADLIHYLDRQTARLGEAAVESPEDGAGHDHGRDHDHGAGGDHAASGHSGHDHGPEMAAQMRAQTAAPPPKGGAAETPRADPRGE